MTRPAKISLIQTDLLSTAKTRADGNIFPLLPELSYLKGGALQKVVGALQSKGFVGDDDTITLSGLMLVDPDRISVRAMELGKAEPLVDECTHHEGLECCPGDYTECDFCDQQGDLLIDGNDEPPAFPDGPTPKKNSKQTLVVEMMQRPDGATLPQIVAATDWTLNTARAFIWDVRHKLGHDYTCKRNGKGIPSTYKIPCLTA